MRQSSGGVCIALRTGYQEKNVVVHRWDAKLDRWDAIATVPFSKETDARLLAVGSEGIWLTDRKSLICYDPKKKSVEAYDFPVGLNSLYDDGRGIQAERDTIFLTANAGLWRFDRRKRTWAEWPTPTTSTHVQPKVLAADETSVWGALSVPSTTGQTLFRFEPATRRFAFFDERTGLPGGVDGRLLTAGKGAWFLHDKGAFRFDAAAGRFVREAEFRASYLAASVEGSAVWIAGSGSAYDAPTLYRWSRAGTQTMPEEPSKKNHCRHVLPSGNGALLATDQGLFRTSQAGIWEPIDAWGLSPNMLTRTDDGAVWATVGELGFLRIDARAGL